MKVYNVEILYERYEDKYETHRLFSTEEKALEYANSIIELEDDGYIMYPTHGHIYEIEVDSNEKKHLLYFVPEYRLVPMTPPSPDDYIPVPRFF